MNPLPLPERHRPRTLGDILGQPVAVARLASYLASPHPAAMLFVGPTGTGKTSAARVLASSLGCDPDHAEAGGLFEVPSGRQDGVSVRQLLDSLRVRPMLGSGWKVAVVNECDSMTPGAESSWLDGLECLPQKALCVFTTNDASKLSGRFVGRCESVPFAGSSGEVGEALELYVRRVWLAETGRVLGLLPEGLGRTDAGRDELSFRLALQQIAPYAREGLPLPDRFVPPLGVAVLPEGPGKRAARRFRAGARKPKQ